MPLHKLEDVHRRAVAEVVDDIANFVRTEGASSLIFLIESPRRRRSLTGVVGRFRADPRRAIGELAVLKSELVQFASNEFTDSAL